MSVDGPIWNEEAERAVIGSVIRDSKLITKVGGLTKDHFYHPKHSFIWETIQELHAGLSPIDSLTVAESAGHMVSDVNDFVADILASTPLAMNISQYADIVKEKHLRREIDELGVQAIHMAREEAPEAALEAISSALAALHTTQVKKAPVRLFDIILQRTEHYEKMAAGELPDAWPCSIPTLNSAMSGGFRPGKLYFIGARPGVGKSSLSAQILIDLAEDGKPGLFLSQEMSKEEVADRIVANRGRIEFGRLLSGDLRDDDWSRASEMIDRVQHLPVFIDDQGALTLSDIRHKVHSVKGLKVLVLDYLQLCSGSAKNKSGNRNSEIEELSRGLKALAMDLGIAIIALSQLNREVEKRPGKRPLMSDLRDCVTADTLVPNADTGELISVGNIVKNNLRFNTVSIDENLKLQSGAIVDAWSTGVQDVFLVKTRSGRVIKATAGHLFKKAYSWERLDSLKQGDFIACPRKIPAPSTVFKMDENKAVLLGWMIGDAHLKGSVALTTASIEEAVFAKNIAQNEFGIIPSIKKERETTSAYRVTMTSGYMCGAGKNPLTNWLRKIGAFGYIGENKHVPSCVFKWSNDCIAGFLRGLFHADGSATISSRKSSLVIRLATISKALASGVQLLLTRLGILSHVSKENTNKSGYKGTTEYIWIVRIGERNNCIKFMEKVGFLLDKHENAMKKVVYEKLNDASGFDRIPFEVSCLVKEIKHIQKKSHQQVGWRDQGKRMSRSTALIIGDRLNSSEIKKFGESDVTWDEIESIEYIGKEETYDLTVDKYHNFTANGIIVHNCGSIEQDADGIIFLWPLRDLDESGKLVGLELAKNRQGRPGVAFALDFRGSVQRWMESMEPINEDSGDQKQYKGGY